MSAATAPRLTGPAIASVVFHTGLIAAFLLLRATPAPQGPPVYRVQLFAAPAAPPSTGVVQEPAAPTPTPTPAPTPVKAAPPRPKVPATKAKVPPAPKAATAPPTTKPAEPQKTTAPPPVAGSGETGGRGADVVTVDTHGIEFPYPGYTNNIVNKLITYFGQANMSLVAEVRFVIRRDGSVGSIQIVTSSRNYSFDQRAVGAVEAAANAKAFGPLPDGFREDILPVTFRFSPSLKR